MRKASLNPGYLGQSTVAPMIALSYYFDFNNDYNASGYSSMGDNSTIRFIMGMNNAPSAATDNNGSNNARESIYKLSDILIVIKDQPEEDPDDPGGGGDGEGGGSGGGSGDGSGSGGSGNSGGAISGSGESAGSKSEDTGATKGDGNNDGEGYGWASNKIKSESEREHETRLREVDQKLRDVVPKAEINNPYTIATLLVASFMVIWGGYRTRRRFKLELEGPKTKEK